MPESFELEPYDPVSKKNLADGIVRRIARHQTHQLPSSESFVGAGVYLLYYTGPFSAYQELVVSNRGVTEGLERPIYVGKADPPGTRRGSNVLNASGGTALHERLKNHASRIGATANLRVAHFRFRFVVLDHVWIRLGEAGLIDHFRPVWNALLDGFGSKIPGQFRQGQTRSAWDTVHPGRGWPELLGPGKKQKSVLLKDVREFLSTPFNPDP